MTTDIKEPPEPREILKYINSTPVLQSLLYDIDLMPEQLKPDSSDYIKMLNIGLHFMRAQSAKLSAQTAVKTEQPSLSDALDLYEAQTEALPLGYDIPERGSSAYNWQTAVIRDIRALLAQRQDSDKDAELMRLREIARLIGAIYVYGDFEAETHNERELEALLREQGTFWQSASEYEDAIANGAPK